MRMELGNGVGWSTDLAWGQSLIVLNVVFHAISLGLINKAVASRLRSSVQHWHHVFLYICVVGGTALSTAMLYAIEVSSWAAALPTCRGIARPAVCNALFDERYNQLRPPESLFGSALANDGLARSVERLDCLWSHRGFPVCYSSESVVA
jgi:hypothetical protein